MDRKLILEDLLLAAFCLLATAVGLAVVVWEVVSGRVFYMDGLWLTLISLTLAAVFGGSLAWSFYTGEGQQMLREFRKKPAAKNAPQENSPAPQ
jgi:ABC-type nickel/cobalt efflux system permease component RcnA